MQAREWYAYCSRQGEGDFRKHLLPVLNKTQGTLKGDRVRENEVTDDDGNGTG